MTPTGHPIGAQCAARWSDARLIPSGVKQRCHRTDRKNGDLADQHDAKHFGATEMSKCDSAAITTRQTAAYTSHGRSIPNAG